MTNSYFNYTDPVQPGDRIESNKYNGDFGAIARAFDTLPSPDELATNTSNYAVSTGTGTAYSVNLPSFDESFGYLDGMQVIMKAHVTNTGSATLSINGGTPVVIRNRNTGSAGNGYALVAGDLAAGVIYSIRYDGTEFQVVNSVAGALTSAQTAASTATSAASSATASASAAAGSASAANASAASAAQSATSASGSASTATTAATNATTAATNAANSASAAAGSATSASGSASAASGSATSAAGSAATATTQASNAASSMAAAQSSASSAATSASQAQTAASAAEAVLTDEAFRNAVMAQLLSTSVQINCVKFFAANVFPESLFPGTTWVRLPADHAIRTTLADASDVMTTSGAMDISLSAANMPNHGHTGTVSIQDYNYGSPSVTPFTYGNINSSSYNFGTVNVSSYDYGTVQTAFGGGQTVNTSNDGSHTHNMVVTNAGTGTNTQIQGTATPQSGAAGAATLANGLHNHSVSFAAHQHVLSVPAHSHSINLGSHSHTLALGSHTHTATVATHGHTVNVTVQNQGNGASFSIRNRAVKLVGWRRTA